MIVRSDLPIGVAAAQICHAAGESSPGNLPSGTYAVVLSAKTERDLWVIACQLEMAGLEFVKIQEPDAPYNGQLMAIGLRPIQRSIGRRTFLSSLPLYRGPSSAPVPARDGSKPAGAPINGGVAQM